MPTTDRALFRNGKVVLKVRDLPDAMKLMYKPFLITEERIMKLTDAPGWDQEHVDAEFTEGIKGGVRYTRNEVQYDITIKDFREHAFVKDIPPYGPQYHVHAKYYRTTGLRTVSPRREPREEAPAPVLPAKVSFGEWIPCTKCGTSGKAQKERCPKCQGLGFVSWSSVTS